MKRRFISLLLIALMLVSCFTGCSSSKKEVVTKTEDEAVVTEAAKADDVTEPTQTAEKLSGNIVYWSMWQETEPQADILKNAISRFEEANPGCTVTVEWDGRTIKDLVLPALEAGTQIDIFDTDPTGLYKADATKLMDLSEFFDSPTLDGTQTIGESILGGLVNWDLGLAEAAGLTGNHSLPYSPYIVSWFYNKAQFTEAGITKVPETWAELNDVCAKLKAAGFTPITIDDAYRDQIFDLYIQRAIGTEAATTLGLENGDLWDNPMLLQMLEAMQDFAEKGYFSKFIDSNIYPAGQTEFALGNATMTINGSWFPSEVADTVEKDFEWGQFAFPTVENSTVPITENTIGGQSFMVNAATENKVAVYELLRYFVSEGTQQEFYTNGLVPCTNKTEWPAEVVDQKAMVAALTGNVGWAADLETDFVLSAVNPEVTKVMAGDQSAADCLDKIKKQAAKYKTN